GDPAALERLFVAFYPRILKIAEVRLGRRLTTLFDPADIAQSVFGRALRSLPRYEDRGPGSFGAWLEAIVNSTIREKARWVDAGKRSSHSEDTLPAEELPANSTQGPSGLASRREEVESLHLAMKSLTDHERRTVEVRMFLSLKGAEAAEVLGVSEEAA